MTVEAQRRYRDTERGRLNVRVTSRAQSYALSWVRRNHPDVWSALLDQAWRDMGEAPIQAGRPRGSAGA